ncbi:hypothetical protein G1K37_09600 [Tenacibaculum dicentrarchi]|nr:hypothetical protein [Tenacibaculum dicentrarchi]
MSDKEKIKKFLANKGISKNKFYSKTGLSSSFLDRGESLGVDKLRIIIDNYPDFNLNILFAGKGEMLVSEKAEKSEKAENNELQKEINDLYKEKFILLKENSELQKKYVAILEENNVLQKKYLNLLEENDLNETKKAS